MQKVQSSKMKLQQIAKPTNFGLFHLLLISFSWFWAFHLLLILLCKLQFVNADIGSTGHDGLEALMQSFDADGISLDPCQLQNSSNTGQFSLRH